MEQRSRKREGPHCVPDDYTVSFLPRIRLQALTDEQDGSS